MLDSAPISDSVILANCVDESALICADVRAPTSLVVSPLIWVAVRDDISVVETLTSFSVAIASSWVAVRPIIVDVAKAFSWPAESALICAVVSWEIWVTDSVLIWVVVRAATCEVVRPLS